jgi:hypothetical protein
MEGWAKESKRMDWPIQSQGLEDKRESPVLANGNRKRPFSGLLQRSPFSGPVQRKAESRGSTYLVPRKNLLLFLKGE